MDRSIRSLGDDEPSVPSLDLETAYRFTINTRICRVGDYPLYIGSAYFDVEDLRDLGVTAVLNATDEWFELPWIPDWEFDVCWNESNDDGTWRGEEYWARSLEWASEVLESGDVVYVFCHAGVNRSSSNVYLILRGYYGLGKFAAGDLLRESRSQVSSRYWRQVDEFLESELGIDIYGNKLEEG